MASMTLGALELLAPPFKALIGTSLVAPCLCGSGRQYVECCLVAFLDKPCECGSGRNLRDCCVNVGEARDTARADVPT